jgi:glycosyltransferase involved in cell wall biosynthesis
MPKTKATHARLVSVIIPACNEEAHIGEVVRAVIQQDASDRVELQVIVVDDGSTDATAEAARLAGAAVLELPDTVKGGNAAAARNRGVAEAAGDPLIFLDADCVPAEGWLQAILAAHEKGATIVGGSLELPSGLSPMARCDYYCGWYLVHPRRPAGYVPHHPPPNIGVRREAFLGTSGFSQLPPLDYTNEERAWQAELRRTGHRIYFEPKAMAYHYNRPGFGNLLRRNYRWGYTAIESKSRTGSARMAWLYKYPRLLIAASLPLAFAHTAYILGCWLSARTYEPLVMSPVVLTSRFAYVAGMVVGGLRWFRHEVSGASSSRPRPRWR